MLLPGSLMKRLFLHCRANNNVPLIQQDETDAVGGGPVLHICYIFAADRKDHSISLVPRAFSPEVG